MTEDEKDAEFGRLLRERAALRETLACLKSKLLSASAAFKQAGQALSMDAEWPLSDDDTIVVPALEGVYDMERSRQMPSTTDFARWLRERKAATARLAEINSILPD